MKILQSKLPQTSTPSDIRFTNLLPAEIKYYSEALNRIIMIPYLSKIKYGVVFCDTWKNPKNSKWKFQSPVT